MQTAAAGKQRSSLNALRHGLTGHVIVLPSEDHAAYARHTQRLFDDLQPKGALEQQLVQSLADTSWRINHAAVAMAAFVGEQTRARSNLSSHEHRFSRQFERTLQQLREIQAERLEKENDQMEKAARIPGMHKAEGTPYNPAEDGFVFSNDEIETSIRRNQRLREANHAYYASYA